MTPESLQQCLKIIGWSPEHLAAKLECHISLIEAWLSGDIEIPPKTYAWISTLAACHRAAEQGKPTSLKGKKAWNSTMPADGSFVLIIQERALSWN